MSLMLRAILVGLVLVTMPAIPANAARLAPGQPLTSGFAEALLTDALRDAGAGETLAIQLATPSLPMGNPARIAAEITVGHVDYEPRSRHFSARFMIRFDDGTTTGLAANGRVRELVEVAVPVRPLARGDVIGAADLDWIQVSADRLRADSITEHDDLVGMEVRRRLRAGRLVRGGDVGAVRLVRRGRPVRMIYASRGLRLDALGKALDSGAAGDIVRVVNVASHRQLLAVVSGPEQVTLTSELLP